VKSCVLRWEAAADARKRVGICRERVVVTVLLEQHDLRAIAHRCSADGEVGVRLREGRAA
jgi:hypothetical protein